MRSLPLTPTRDLVDTFGRRHNNLRISVTDRCNLRCTYCMPEDVTFLDRAELLTFEEIARFVRVAASLGVDKVRLTGEPLLHRDLHRLVAQIAAIPGIRDIGLTTNGLLLAAQAQLPLRRGTARINTSASIRSIRADSDSWPGAWTRAGSRRPGRGRGGGSAKPIKLNAAVISAASTSATSCRSPASPGSMATSSTSSRPMPIGADHLGTAKVFTAAEILEVLEADRPAHYAATDTDPGSPATGIATSTAAARSASSARCRGSRSATADRIRLTAEGALRNCLFATDEVDLRPMLRGAAGRGDRRPHRRQRRRGGPGHEIDSALFVKPARTMHAIGG